MSYTIVTWESYTDLTNKLPGIFQTLIYAFLLRIFFESFVLTVMTRANFSKLAGIVKQLNKRNSYSF